MSGTDRPTTTKDEIEITPEMIEAGFAVLCSSGIAADYMKADKVLVAQIFDAMIEARAASAPAPRRG